MTIKIYYSHPIDFADVNMRNGNSQHVEEMKDRRWVVFDPAAAWSLAGDTPPNPTLMEANLGILRGCSGMLAWLPAGVQTIGVVIEMCAARNEGIPFTVITPVRSWGLSWLTEDVFTSAEAAIVQLSGMVAR